MRVVDMTIFLGSAITDRLGVLLPRVTQPHLPKAGRPFVTPRDRPCCIQTTAETGTTASPVLLIAHGNTGVTSTMGYTQGTPAIVSASSFVNSRNSSLHSNSHNHPSGPNRAHNLPGAGERLETVVFDLPSGIVSPIRVDALQALLVDYPNSRRRTYLLNGFRFGFDIGFRGEFVDLHARPRNLLSSLENPAGVSEAIQKELTRGHTSGPFSSPPFPFTHCSPIGAAPKPDGSVRLILDLSSPRGDSVNDGISQEDFACKFSNFDDAVTIVQRLGPNAWLSKIDIKHAFRICPVLPSQWPLLCFQWMGSFYTDTRLPFGSRSSPFIFNEFAQALAWIISFVGGVAFLIHYLDDFFFANTTQQRCQRDMEIFLSLCERLGVPIASDKTEGPERCLTYLGIEIDAQNMCIRLPADKLTKLKKLLKQWSHKRKVLKKDLLSLIGFLSFACKVIKPGRLMLRRLIDLSTTVKSDFHYIYLNAETREDIKWWNEFLPDWNGVSVIQQAFVSSEDLQLFTDASDLGIGGVFGDKWFYSPLRDDWSPQACDINCREMLALWAAVTSWGHLWVNKQIVIFSDNQAVVDVWKKGVAKHPRMLKLLRSIFFYAARNNINIMVRHIPGLLNTDADLLSRLQVHEFLLQHPSAEREPTPVMDRVWIV